MANACAQHGTSAGPHCNGSLWLLHQFVAELTLVLLLVCREAIGAPGMVVLQFAWGGGTNNVHLPHMHYENSFCYPGTHDNETAVGWWKGSANAQDKQYLKAYLGVDGSDIAWDFIKAAMASVSQTTIFLMQVGIPLHMLALQQ
jgi:4-alpha-glucanotransferase